MAEPIYLNTVNGAIVANNKLTSQGGEGADAYGIGAPSANNVVIENNIIVATGTKMTYGISNTKSENVTIRNNDITAEGIGAVGVGLSQDSNVEVSDNKIIVPLRRGPEDINIEADIVEEIIRIYGYEKIDTLKTQSSVESKDFNTDVATLRSIEETLTKICRYSQLETYPWISDKMLQAF